MGQSTLIHIRMRLTIITFVLTTLGAVLFHLAGARPQVTSPTRGESTKPPMKLMIELKPMPDGGPSGAGEGGVGAEAPGAGATGAPGAEAPMNPTAGFRYATDGTNGTPEGGTTEGDTTEGSLAAA